MTRRAAYYYETDFTWNVGAGFRWNVTDQLFIKVMGGAQWLQYSGAQMASPPRSKASL